MDSVPHEPARKVKIEAAAEGYYQNTIQEEFNNDGNGNTVDAYLEEWEQVRGNSISFNFGIIAKVSRALRIGLSYETASK